MFDGMYDNVMKTKWRWWWKWECWLCERSWLQDRGKHTPTTLVNRWVHISLIKKASQFTHSANFSMVFRCSSDSMKIRNSRAAPECFVVLCVLLKLQTLTNHLCMFYE